MTLQFNLGSLGLDGKQLDVLDTLTDNPVTLTPQGDLAIALGLAQWTYVWLRPKSVVKQWRQHTTGKRSSCQSMESRR